MTARAEKRVPKCQGCGKPLERRFATPRVEKMKYDGARHEVLIEGMPHWQCDRCEITLTDDESDTVVQDCLRRHIGLLTAEEIREARTSLGLTQSQLAELIRCAAESLSRWENGAILQSRSYDRLLRLFFHLPIARDLLRKMPQKASRS
jgi:putative zinc finger/helix-turn-helix YgiT family protein